MPVYIYEVWIDDETAIECTSIAEAIAYAEKGPYLVTERMPIGDRRVMLVEELADGYLNGEKYKVPREIKREAVKALRERGAYDAE